MPPAEVPELVARCRPGDQISAVQYGDLWGELPRLRCVAESAPAWSRECCSYAVDVRGAAPGTFEQGNRCRLQYEPTGPYWQVADNLQVRPAPEAALVGRRSRRPPGRRKARRR